MVVLTPVDEYLLNGFLWPNPRYVEHYLVNVWLAMEFLEKEGLCSDPSL